MKDENEYIGLNFQGRASKVDKWKYNDILNDIARRTLYVLDTPSFGSWVKKFVKALRVVNVKNLPLKKIIDEQDNMLRQIYYNKTDNLKKKYEIWYDEYKRDYYLSKWEEEYWIDLFDFCLEMATKAGFTLHLDNVDESIAMRMKY